MLSERTGKDSYMNDRENRINQFKDFKDSSSRIFKEFAKNDKSNKRLSDLFTFHVSPGGIGRINDKIIEIKYGSRSIGIKKEFGPNLEIQESSEFACGASLHYTRTDNGYVLCTLYPATSENQKPTEDGILLGFLKNPAKLEKKAKYHWRMFISYMETTCIDGDPSFIQKLNSFYLLNFKRYLMNDRVQDSKVKSAAKYIIRMSLTVGLSGFLLFGITRYWDSKESDTSDSYCLEMHEKYEQVINILNNIQGQIENTNEILDSIISRTRK